MTDNENRAYYLAKDMADTINSMEDMSDPDEIIKNLAYVGILRQGLVMEDDDEVTRVYNLSLTSTMDVVRSWNAIHAHCCDLLEMDSEGKIVVRENDNVPSE